MKKFCISIIIFHLLLPSIDFQNISSPICDNKTDLIIDSILVKNKKTVYLFTDKTISILEVKGSQLEFKKNSNITDFFIPKPDVEELKPPFNISYRFWAKDYVFYYIYNCKEWHHWDILMDNNTVHSGTAPHISEPIPLNTEKELCDNAISTPNINDTHIFVITNTGRDLKFQIHNPYSSAESLADYYLRTDKSKTKVGLCDKCDNNTKPLLTLNGRQISSGFILNDRMYLIANRFYISLSYGVNDWKDFKVRHLSELVICGPTPVTPVTQAPNRSKFLTKILIIIVLVVAIIAVLVVIIWWFLNLKKRKTPQNIAPEVSKNDIKAQKRKSQPKKVSEIGKKKDPKVSKTQEETSLKSYSFRDSNKSVLAQKSSDSMRGPTDIVIKPMSKENK